MTRVLAAVVGPLALLAATGCGGGSVTTGSAPTSAQISSAPAVTAASANGAGAQSPGAAGASVATPAPSLGATTTGVTGATTPTTAAAKSMLPSVQVFDVASGNRLDLASLAPADKPILFWMWAPY